IEARLATLAILQHDGPCYLRLSRGGKCAVHEKEFDFEIGKAVTVRRGEDLAFITTGSVLEMGVRAANELEKQGISTAVLSMHTVKPLDAAAVLTAARATGHIISLEEHSARNGLGTAIADVLAQSTGGVSNCRFRKLAIPDAIIHDVGDQEYLRRHLGDPVRAALELLEGKVSKVQP
ncbi:MAG: transketolase C-terminal domain-containing protein, partial [Planctomycetota bacterium]